MATVIRPAARRTRAPAAFLSAALLSAALLALPGCGGPPEPVNLVVIVVDTLRADHLGAFGHPRGTSAKCDALARESVVFSDAMSTSPWTLPSFASLFTSRSNSGHGVTWLGSALRDDEVTLAEVLRDAGYRTGAFVNNPLLDPKRGLGQGFEQYETYGVLPMVATNRGERAPLPQVEAWLDAAGDRPFFLLVHFMEPHAPYLPTGPLARRFDPGYDGPSPGMFPDAAQLAAAPLDTAAPPDLTAARRYHAEALYDAEILETDRQIGRILAALETRRLDGDTIVVLLSDHGEEFWDHGAWGHGQSLHQELVRVPLVVRTPPRLGIPPRTDPSTVSLVDLAPTLLPLLGVEIPDTFEGRALDLRRDCGSAPVIAGATHSGPARQSYQRDGWKLDLELFGAVAALYDVTRDPGERVDRARTDSARVAELKVELLAGASGGSGWRIGLRGAPGGTSFEGTLRTTGRILRVWPHRLEDPDGRGPRDRWKDTGDEVQFRIRGGTDARKGLMLQLEPADAPLELTVSVDGRSRPGHVRIGPSGQRPSGDGPWLVSADSARMELGRAPAEEGTAGPSVAVWYVAPSTGERPAARLELDEETREELRALGYVR